MHQFRCRRVLLRINAVAVLVATGTVCLLSPRVAQAQANPTISLPGLGVRTVATGLSTPTGIAFLGPADFFVIEKNTGRIKRVRDGVVNTVLDLTVNNASERGLLGIVVAPDFGQNPSVYIYWTCATATPGTTTPVQISCSESEFTTGSDTSDILRVPLLGNRVDEFTWNPASNSLSFRRNILRLRSFQADGAPDPPNQGDIGQPAFGNHNGGVMGFGPDGKLYVFVGDQGRRGQMQNLQNGPTPPQPDDQFGGPQPDNAHLSGVLLRLNPDGSAPQDNPFFQTGTTMGDEAGENLKRVFAYGLRNSFGLAFEPATGTPWITEHGDDAFDEVNRVVPGMNGGWIQVRGPVSRYAEYRSIEADSSAPGTLQQWRWPATNLANSATEALARMYMLPGAVYQDPPLSWRYVSYPVGIEFISGRGLGLRYQGDLFMSLVFSPAESGYLARVRTTRDGRGLVLTGPLADGVADNNFRYDKTESQSLIVGSGFGLGTQLKMSPQGTLFFVSYTNGAVYEVYGRETVAE